MSEVLSNTESWENFYKSTQHLKQANSADDMFSDTDISDLTDIVKRAITIFLESEVLHQNMKVYVDKSLSNGVIDEMSKRPPGENESLEQWCDEIFGSNKFGVIFQGLEDFSNDLTEKMCTIVTPLLKRAGLPLGGLSFLFFMGNYGFTPFGIHKEATGEEGFLFHLGPANKKFHTWDNEELNKIEHNTKVFHEVEEMLPLSKCYELKPKSVMFIPHHLYHIGNTEEFSLSVVMDYINPSRTLLERTIAKEISANKSKSSISESFLEPISMNSADVDWNKLFYASSWENRYKNATERRLKRLKSNFGVLKPSIEVKSNFLPQGQFDFKGKSIFPLIEYEDEDSNIFILARGHEIQVKSHPNVSMILSKLNNKEVLNVADLQRWLNPEWDLVDILGLLNQLLHKCAIEIL